jgi:integrating conjugative element protein (TIGR03755 family)
MKTSSLFLAVFAAALFSSSALAADTSTFKLGVPGNVIDDELQYQIGGGSVAPPASTYIPNLPLIDINGLWHINAGCGGLSIMSSLKNAFDASKIKNGMMAIMTQIESSVGGMMSNIPMMILQRADPGLYEMFTNGLMQARMDFDRNKLSCENLSNDVMQLATTKDWSTLAKGQTLSSWFSSGNSDATDATLTMDKVDSDTGTGGIPWVFGDKAGGEGQDPIRTTQDIVTAGYASLNNQTNKLSSAQDDPSVISVSTSSCGGAEICTLWKNAGDAVKFAKNVLGESEIKTCSDDCGSPKTSQAGMGLAPEVDKTFKTRVQSINELISGRQTMTVEHLADAGSAMLPVSRGVIEALRSDPDQQLLVNQLASEIAMSDTLERALQLQRILIAGMKNPNVQQTKPLAVTTKANLDALSAEIQNLKTEMEVRKALNNNTAMLILQRRENIRNSAAQQENSEQNRSRILDLDKSAQ